MSLMRVRRGKAAVCSWADTPSATAHSAAAIRTTLVDRMCTAVEYYPRASGASSADCQCPVPTIDPHSRPAYARDLPEFSHDKGFARVLTRSSVYRWRMPLLLLIYALNTAYLAAFASPTIFYFANVVFHIVAGIALTIAWMWRTRRGLNATVDTGGSPWRRLITIGAAAVLAIGLAFGLLITIVGAAGRWRWLLPTHIALSMAGGVPLRSLVSSRCSVAATRGSADWWRSRVRWRSSPRWRRRRRHDTPRGEDESRHSKPVTSCR